MPQDQHPELQIGGQAVLEGVVMRTPEKWALAVRRPCGDIYTTVNPVLTLAQRYPRLNVFPVRGIFALADSLVIGMKALSISGGISLEEADGPNVEDDGPPGEADRHDREGLPPETDASGKPSADGDPAPRDGSGPGCEGAVPPPSEEGPDPAAESPVGTTGAQGAITTAQMGISIVFALAIFVGLFFVVPAVLTKKVDDVVANTVVYNLIEGGIRIGIFVLYLVFMSLIPDLKRVFQYHGAEHKVVHAYESGDSLTPGEAKEFSTAHLRCGTAFILIVFVLSILVFSLMGRPALWLRVLERIAIIPLVAAMSYEIIRFAGRHERSRIVRALMSPGLLLQKLTTRQPDERQLEVAIRALEAATGEAGPAAVGETGASGTTA